MNISCDIGYDIELHQWVVYVYETDGDDTNSYIRCFNTETEAQNYKELTESS